MRQNTQGGISCNSETEVMVSGRKAPVPTPALQAACLTAGLVTAFTLGTNSPVNAQVVTDQGYEVFGLALVETDSSGQITIPVADSRPIGSAPGGAKGIALFTEAAQQFVGQNFTDVFGVDENLVLSYLVDGNAADKASYDLFLANLPENFILNSTYTSSGADHLPNYFTLFSDGQYIGSYGLPLASIPLDTHFAGFGVTLEPLATTPEPGAALAMLLGGMGVAGQQMLWRRKARNQSQQQREQ